MSKFKIDFQLDAIPKRPGIYIVGGAVRDRLLGRDSIDIDIAVQENPQKLAGQIADRTHSRVITLGLRTHPLYRVVTPHHIIDISALQGDSIETDLERRDFTINALAWETWTQNIIDVTRGIKDIHDRQIRQVTLTSFQSDPVRLLRAYRLASQLNFNIEPKTRRSMNQAAHLIRASAMERIQAELTAILATSRAHHWLTNMADSTILFHIVPELKALIDCRQGSPHAVDVFEHTMQALRALGKLVAGDMNTDPEIEPLFDPMNTQRTSRLYWAALFHDIGKPITRQESSNGQIRFDGHDKAGAQMTAAIGKRLRLPRKEINSIAQLVRHHLRPHHLFKAFQHNQLRPNRITRFFLNTKGYTCDLLILALADMRAKARASREFPRDFENFLAKVVKHYTCDFISRAENPPLIDGFDLIDSLELRPSPLFKKILRHVREAQLNGQINSPKEALALAAKMLSSKPIRSFS